MREEVVDLDALDQPDSLRPTPTRDFPVRRLDADGSESIALWGRRAEALGTAAQGIRNVSVDGHEIPLPSTLVAQAPSAPADIVEVGVDRLFRRWDSPLAPFEELWVVPLSRPFAVYLWRRGALSGGHMAWRRPADAGAASRLSKIAASWSALDRSWKRDTSESANVQGPVALENTWSWSRARLLSAVRRGPDRDQVCGHPTAGKTTAAERGWLALGLGCLGRSDLSTDVVRRIKDLGIRSHAVAWINRWTGSDGPQPDEEAEAFPDMLALEGRTDHRLAEWPTGPSHDPVEAAAFCGRLVDQGFGIRPDSHFGRVRFGPSQHVLTPSGSEPLRLGDLCVGRGKRPVHMSFAWSHELGSEGDAVHTFEVVPGLGSIPLQLVFEPRLKMASIGSATLDGQRVEPEVSQLGGLDLRVRLQCPLDGPRTLRIQGRLA